MSKHPLRNTAWFLTALNFDFRIKDGFHRPRQVLYRFQCEVAADPSLRRYGRGKANSIETVIDARPNAALDLKRLTQKSAQEGQREESMRNRCLVGRLSPRSLAIDMDPLMIARRFREVVDLLLRDLKPLGHADFVTDQVVQGL
jgi:hypothetical protein